MSYVTYEEAATRPKLDTSMSVASKLLNALRASPLSLTYGLLMCGLWVMALPVAALADLLILIWKQLVRLKRRLCSYVTWKPPKGGYLGLLKRHLPKISIPL